MGGEVVCGGWSLIVQHMLGVWVVFFVKGWVTVVRVGVLTSKKRSAAKFLWSVISMAAREQLTHIAAGRQ